MPTRDARAAGRRHPGRPDRARAVRGPHRPRRPGVGGDLLDRVKALRKKVASDIGIVMPPGAHARQPRAAAEDLRRSSCSASRSPAARRRPGTVLAIGEYLSTLPGTPVKEPVFGLDAKWIPAELRAQAEISGITVVDRASVLTTHLADVVRNHAGRLLGREDVKVLTDVVKRSHPVVVDELTPTQLSLGEVQRVLQGLLDEQVADPRPGPDLRGALAAGPRDQGRRARSSRSPAARSAPAIVQPYVSDGGVHVISFEPQLEQRMLEALRPTEEGSVVAFDMETGQVVLTELARLMVEAENQQRARRSSSARRSCAPPYAGWCSRRSGGCRCCPTASCPAARRCARSVWSPAGWPRCRLMVSPFSGWCSSAARCSPRLPCGTPWSTARCRSHRRRTPARGDARRAGSVCRCSRRCSATAEPLPERAETPRALPASTARCRWSASIDPPSSRPPCTVEPTSVRGRAALRARSPARARPRRLDASKVPAPCPSMTRVKRGRARSGDGGRGSGEEAERGRRAARGRPGVTSLSGKRWCDDLAEHLAVVGGDLEVAVDQVAGAEARPGAVVPAARARRRP